MTSKLVLTEVDIDNLTKNRHCIIQPGMTNNQDKPTLKYRIWIDGCFDFAHHGKYYIL